MVRVKIIRHSERLDYTRPIYWLTCFGQYWADTPLTKNGYEMARARGQNLKTDGFDPRYIYTSPYNRTLATSTEIKSSFPNAQLVIEPLLAEYQPNFKHNITLYPNGIPTTYNGIETEYTYPESYDSFEKRVKFIIDQLINRSDSDLIIVTHGEVLKVYINYIQLNFPQIVLEPGSTPYLTTLCFDYDQENGVILPESVHLEKIE